MVTPLKSCDVCDCDLYRSDEPYEISIENSNSGNIMSACRECYEDYLLFVVSENRTVTKEQLIEILNLPSGVCPRCLKNQLGDCSSSKFCTICRRWRCMKCVALTACQTTICECKDCFNYECWTCGLPLDRTLNEPYLDDLWPNPKDCQYHAKPDLSSTNTVRI